MRMPVFVRETLACAKADRLWATAFAAALLLPWMLIFVRAGIEVCAGVIGICFLLHSWRTGDWSWVRTPFLTICAVSYLWLVLVVTPLAVDPGRGLLTALLWFRFPLMFAALCYWVLARPEARMTLALYLCLFVALIVVDTLWQMATGMSLSGNPRIATGPHSGRLTGPFDAPKVGMFIGKLLLPATGLALWAALHLKNRRAAAAVAGLALVAIVAIIFSGERSAFLTIMLALGTVLMVLMLSEKRLRVPGLLAGFSTLTALVVLYYLSPWVQWRAQQIWVIVQHFSNSDYGQLFRAGYEMGMAHLPHGVGLRGFAQLCPELPYMYGTFRGMHPHNAFLEWFAEAGLPGLLLFTAAVAMLVREAVRALLQTRGIERLMPAVALGALVQHFFPLMGMQSFFTNWGAALQWYVLALVFAALPQEARA